MQSMIHHWNLQIFTKYTFGCCSTNTIIWEKHRSGPPLHNTKKMHTLTRKIKNPEQLERQKRLHSRTENTTQKQVRQQNKNRKYTEPTRQQNIETENTRAPNQNQFQLWATDQGWLKWGNAGTAFRAEQGPCEPSKGLASKFDALSFYSCSEVQCRIKRGIPDKSVRGPLR